MAGNQYWSGASSSCFLLATCLATHWTGVAQDSASYCRNIGSTSTDCPPHHPFTMALHLLSFENSALAEEVERRCRVEIKEGYSADG